MSMSMGMEYSMMALSPMFDTAKENTVKRIAQLR